MRVVDGPWTPEPLRRPTVLTFGKFDALHVGHQAIFSEVLRQAQVSDADSAVFFLHPHPLSLLDPARCPPTLTVLPKKLELLEAFGVHVAIIGRFDERLRTTEPKGFLRHLVGHLGARSLVVGQGVRFGYRGAGDVELLARATSELGFELTVVPHQTVDGQPISSTRIRTAISSADLDTAERLLGRPYSISGTVVSSDKRGRALGYPTANVSFGDQQLPPFGIYAGTTVVAGRHVASAISLGVRPTFEDTGVWLEAFLIDFEGDLYGIDVDVILTHRLRDELRFDAVEELQAQIEADVAEVRRLSALTA